MLDIKLIHKKLLDNHIKLMGQISTIIVLFFYFIISIYGIVFLSPKTPENASFIESLNSLGIYFYVILLFLSILVVLSPSVKKGHFTNYFLDKRIYFIRYFPTLPIFISSIGFTIIFMGILLKNLIIVEIGQFVFLIGLILVSIMLIIKNYLENQIYYSITEAFDILITIDKNNSREVNKFTKFIKLTLGNLNMKMDRKLKINASELGIFHIDTVLNDYLPYYIKFGDETQMESLKKRIGTMSNSVDKNGYFDLKVFTNELIQLSNDIIKFSNVNNLKMIPRFSILNFFRDIDYIKNIGAILFYLIITLLTVVYFFKYGKLPEAIIK